MKKNLLSILILLLSIVSYSQQSSIMESSDSLQLEPFFVGLIVEDVDSTAQWYVDNLGFEIYKVDELPEHGVKAKFLKIDGFRIEMFQHKDAFDVNQYIPESKNLILKRGIVKYGFLVKDVDKLMEDLKSKNVDIYRDMYEDVKFRYKFFLVKDYAGNKIQIFEKLE